MSTLSSTDLESLGDFLGDLNESAAKHRVGLAWYGGAPQVMIGGDATDLYLAGGGDDGYSFSTSEYA